MESISRKQSREEEYYLEENMEIGSSPPHTPDASSRYGANNDDSLFRSPTLSSLRHRKRKLDYSEAYPDEDVLSTKSRRKTKNSKMVDDDYTPRKPRKNKLKSAANTTVGSFQQSAAITRRSAPRDENYTGLFTVLRIGKNLDSAAEQWVTDYEVNPKKAILQILQLFVDSCGCSGILNDHIFDLNVYGEVIEDLSCEFDQDTADYPLGVSSQQWKKFRSNFAKFLALFISKCKREIIYDAQVMDHVLKLLTAFSASPVRAFRHTSTFAAMKLCSAVASIVPQLITSKEKIVIQIKAEKTKMNSVDESSNRLDFLVATKSNLEQKIDDLKMMVDYIFKAILAARYRDVVIDIRCICIEELSECMCIYPAAFMDDAYLRYIGWNLCDKSADVRLKCVIGLANLFNQGEVVERLELFTKTFVDRLTSLVNDYVPEISIKASHIITEIYSAFPSVLEKRHLESIYELVYSSNRSVAVAVGKFLNLTIFQKKHSNSSSMQINPSEAGQFLQNLVRFYHEVDVQQKNISFLVDALIDTNPLLKNWSAMIEMLLHDNGDNGDSQQMAILIEILACAVREAVTGEVPLGRTAIIKRTNSSLVQSTRLMKEEKKRISEVFIPTISKLIDQFIDDSNNLVHLTTVPMHFQFELCFVNSCKLNSYLDDLMQTLMRVVQQHVDEALLQNVAKMISFFSKQSQSVATHIEIKRKEIIDGLASGVRQAMHQYESQSEDELERKDENAEKQLLASYTKIVAFSACVDTDLCGLWDMTLKMVTNEANLFGCAELIEKGIILLFRQLAWQLERITEDENEKKSSVISCDLSHANKIRGEIQELVLKRDQFLACTKVILENSSLGVTSAFLCLCDALIIFNFAIAAEVPEDDMMRSLPIKLNDAFTARITDFVDENVFASIENESFSTLDVVDQIYLIEKRRNYLASYCKLITYGALPIIDASLVLRYYNKFSHHFDDILKALLQKCRELDKVAAAKAIILSLISAYKEIKSFSDNGFVDVHSNEFTELRELSKRFSLSFGPDLIRNREAIVMIHKDGISYALNVEEQRRLRNKDERPSNLSFLDLLIDFTPRLISNDKAVVLNYLEKHCPVNPEPVVCDDERDLFWEPYLNYKKTLLTNKKA